MTDGPATANNAANRPGASTSSVATVCDYCGEPMPIASNPQGQTPIRHFHDWNCYSRFYNLERGGEPLHLMSHDEQVQDGHLFP